MMAILAWGSGVKAQDNSPKPKPKEAALEDLEQKMQQRRKRKERLAQKMQELKNKLESLRARLVDVGEAVQKHETKMSKIETRLADLRKRRDSLETKLLNDRKRLAELVLALQRIERVPPSAMMARPGSPLQTAQSALLLETGLSGIHKRAQKVRKRMSRLDALKGDILSKKRDLARVAQELQAKQRKMRSLVEKRKSMYEKAQSRHKQEKQALRKIAERAEDMKQFIDRLAEKNREQRRKRREQDQNSTYQDRKNDGLRPGDTYMPGSDTTMRNPGQTRLPATGRIDVKFGQKNNMGAISKGLHIQCRPSALVVAPISGVVRYKGPFKNYGKLIIIEHNKNYHSLIAGIDKVDTVVGRKVVAGEPIGRMSNRDDEKHQLYYELRHQGNPVNPARRIAEL
jgi:septal ring factor EnvC (AmiA/AmiB activator)